MDGEGEGCSRSFADILGPNCVIKRVDKDQKVIGHAEPDEMQQELVARAATQKRLGACAEHVHHLPRKEKLQWALDLKDKANECYVQSRFEEAARLYNDCLVALDFDGKEDETAEVVAKLQLPVCTNLAACLIEMGKYEECVRMCDIALSVDPTAPKALYRRGLARYRLGDHRQSRPDLEAALRSISNWRMNQDGASEDAPGMHDLERRIRHYLIDIRRTLELEKANCQKIFLRKDSEKRLYDDRPDRQEEQETVEVDDSDEAIEARDRKSVV